jgi:3-hydroxyisobutyrate dehydrogenase
MTAAGLVSPSQEAFVQALIGKDFEGSYTVGLMMAELSCALTAVESEDMVLPMADAAFHLYELLAIVGGAQYNPAALSLIFSDEETCNEFGLDWSKAEAGHDHDHDDDADDECDCGHHHDDDHECECGHHHHHHDAAADDDDEPLHHGHDHGEAFDEDGNYNEFGGYGTPSKTDYVIDEIDEWN